MNKVIIASIRKSAGKTSAIVGTAAALNKKMAYIKPFGERMLYRKKRLWDYDSDLIANLFGLKEDPVDMSIGFDHSKLRYMYDEEGTQKKLLETIAHVGRDKEILFIEGGRDLSYGISIHLDTLSLARFTGGRLFLVISGDENTIMDDILFLRKHVDLGGVDLGGLILNKVGNSDHPPSGYPPGRVAHRRPDPLREGIDLFLCLRAGRASVRQSHYRRRRTEADREEYCHRGLVGQCVPAKSAVQKGE
jgi:hypothetical protein